jgi:tetratricopeptide (TPR) repeat protein
LRSHPSDNFTHTFPLDSSSVRAVVLGLAAAGVLSLAACAWRDYRTGVLADERRIVGQEELESAAARPSSSASVLARYARVELDAGLDREVAVSRATAAARRAARLSPHDFRLRLLLAEAEEAAGDLVSAEAALRAACGLAPNHSGVRWLAGNFFVRQGRLDEALAELRRAAQGNKEYLPQALDLVWNFAGGDLNKLAAVAGEGAEARLQLARFFLIQGQVREAINVYGQIDEAARHASGWGRDFLQQLIGRGALAEARALWLAEVGGAPELVWNGDFERETPDGLSYFAWLLKASDFARPRIEDGAAHGGRRALRLDLSGRDTLRLQDEVWQTVVVKPGAAYRLECYAKAELSAEVEGIQVTVSGQPPSHVVAQTPAINPRVGDWQRLAVDFTAPPDAGALVIALRRAPKFSYEEPVRGTIWLDDFSLQEQAPGAAH